MTCPLYRAAITNYRTVGWLEFNVPFQHKYGYIRDEQTTGQKYNGLPYSIGRPKKTTARFSCLLRHPAWKRRGLFLFQCFINVTYLLTYLLT